MLQGYETKERRKLLVICLYNVCANKVLHLKIFQRARMLRRTESLLIGVEVSLQNKYLG